MSLQRYYELFLGQVEVVEEVGVTIPDEVLVNSIAAANGRADAPEQGPGRRAARAGHQPMHHWYGGD
jgi:hypothetical protein